MDPSNNTVTRSISPSPNPLYCLDAESDINNDDNENNTNRNQGEPALLNRDDLNCEEKDDVDSYDSDPIGPFCDLQYPRVNCPEKIILCLDMSSEMTELTFKSKSGEKFAPLNLIKRALGLFLQTKSQINSNHQFALVIMQDQACWVCDFTYDTRKIIQFLDEYNKTSDCDSFDLSSVFDRLKENVEVPVVLGDQSIIPPPYVVRAILIYGRSQCQLNFTDRESQRSLESSPYFFLDAFYIHQPVSEDNKCEESFNKLCELDVKGLSYILEISRNPTKLHVSMAQLLAHPLQRPLQSDTNHRIPSAEDR